MTDDIAERFEEAVEKPDEELKQVLPPILEDLDRKTGEALVREHPQVFGRVVNRLVKTDIAAFYQDAPQAADNFHDFLWAGLGFLVEESPEARERIKEDVAVAFKATDCAMEGHFRLNADAKTLTGGATPIADQDLTISGPAKSLVELITGNLDPVRGFMQRKYKMSGSVAKGVRLTPVIQAVAKTIPGEE